MSEGGPFRELFVEVPLALLEAAVHQAQAPKPEPSPAARLSIIRPDVWILVFKNAQERFDWTLIGWERASDHEHIIVRVKLKCGHVGRFIVDEWKLAACAFSKSELCSYLLDKIDEEPIRRCKCGEPQGLGPAGRPT